MDFVHKTLNWADHNRWLVAAAIIGIALSVALIGCQATTQSVLHPETQVTAAELDREALTVQMEAELALKKLEGQTQQLKLAKADIQRQQELRAQIVGIVGAVGTAAAEGAVSPASGIAAAVQLLTLLALGGAVLDNRRKDKVIADATPPATPA